MSVFRNSIHNYIYGRTLDALDGLQLLQYSQADATFTGIEGQVRQRLTRNLGVTLFGDTVRARIDGAGNLPRIPATRAGLRLDGNWNAWEGQVEWVQVARQNRIAAFETTTPGYGMLNLGLSLQRPVQQRHALAGVPEGHQPDGPPGVRAHLVHQERRAADGAESDGGGESGVLTGDAVVMCE